MDLQAVPVPDKQNRDLDKPFLMSDDPATRRLLNSIRRSRITDINSVSKMMAENVVSAVGLFERWIWQYGALGEKRFANDIPPEELDSYLAGFFSSLTHYKSYSFTVLRSNLKKYLSITGYPACLKTSRYFEKSREAYKKTLKALQLNEGALGWALNQSEPSQSESNVKVAKNTTSRSSESSKRNFIRSRIPEADRLPTATLRNLITCVRTFERWLSECPRRDARNITEIPLTELDEILANFYRTAKTPQGTDYKLQSKLCLRSNLDRYLKYHNYPSIVKSPVFWRSQDAFRKWTKK